jgi:hypothetical protein
MKTCRVVIADNGRTLVDLAQVALTSRERLVGLMGRADLPPGEGLLILDCWSVHTFFMRFPIDVAYISSKNAVVKIVEGLKPSRVSACWGARSVLEMPSGWALKMGLSAGQVLVFQTHDAPT